MKYWVEVKLVMEDEVEANSEAEAVDILCDAAVMNGEWLYTCEEIEDWE